MSQHLHPNYEASVAYGVGREHGVGKMRVVNNQVHAGGVKSAHKYLQKLEEKKKKTESTGGPSSFQPQGYQQAEYATRGFRPNANPFSSSQAPPPFHRTIEHLTKDSTNHLTAHKDLY